MYMLCVYIYMLYMCMFILYRVKVVIVLYILVLSRAVDGQILTIFHL